MKKYSLLFLFLVAVTSMNAQTTGQLTVTVTTSSTDVGFAPNNIVAVWIQDNSGKFVKTLLAFADAQTARLTNWVTATPVGNTTDATTGATQTEHGTRTCTWNGTNVSKAIVADGTYTVKMEMAESNSGSRVGTFTFEKGPNAITLTPTNIPSFSNINITWTPNPTAIEKVLMDKLYSIYPNPAHTFIYVSGPDIKKIQIQSLSGANLLVSNQQKVDLSTLVRGSYLLKVVSESGSYAVKFIKE